MPHPFFDPTPPVVIGHRGAAGERPENTLPSFQHALAEGAAVLESDVHATRDGVVVVFHDDTLERTTDGSGRVSDHTLAELQALDAGYRFTPDDGHSHPFRGQGIRIPTLAEAFDAFPDARFNLELKEPQRELIEGAVELVRQHGRVDRTLLAAGHDAVMKELRAEVARSGVRVAIGASAGEVAQFVRATLEAAPPPEGVMALQVPEAFAGQPLVTEQFVQHAKAHDIHVHVWTINDAEAMHRLFDLGVHGIVSDFPGRLAEVVASRR